MGVSSDPGREQLPSLLKDRGSAKPAPPLPLPVHISIERHNRGGLFFLSFFSHRQHKTHIFCFALQQKMLRKDGVICFRRCLPSSASLPSPLASKRGATEGQIQKWSPFLGVYFPPFFFLFPETQPACHFLIHPSPAWLSHAAEPDVLKHRREPLHASLFVFGLVCGVFREANQLIPAALQQLAASYISGDSIRGSISSEKPNFGGGT